MTKAFDHKDRKAMREHAKKTEFFFATFA